MTKHQVVQLLTGGDGDSAFRFRLIHLAVAQEGVNGLLRGVFQTAVFQIFQEFGLIDSAPIGPRPMDTVGNCQNSGISFGCG